MKRTRRWLSGALAALLLAALTLPAQAAAFTDVPADHWAAADIQYVVERGLFNGTGSTTFAPGADMSRAMLATVLYRYAGSPEISTDMPYWDVPQDQWFSPGIAWARANAIFPEALAGATQLNPDSTVRRGEFAVMLYNFARTLGKAEMDPAAVENHPFTDLEFIRFSLSGHGWLYRECMDALLGWAYPVGIVTGRTETQMDALGLINRAEVAAMLSRFDRLVLGGTQPTVTIPEQTGQTEQPEQTPAGEEAAQTGEATLANGKPVTEENAYEIMLELWEKYPAGTLYGAPYRSNSQGPYGSSSRNCAGWAILCSDAIFGDLPWRRIENPSWDQIRIGDLVEFDTDTSGHVVVVFRKGEDYILVTESGRHNESRWGGMYFHWWLEEQPGCVLHTRYPE